MFKKPNKTKRGPAGVVTHFTEEPGFWINIFAFPNSALPRYTFLPAEASTDDVAVRHANAALFSLYCKWTTVRRNVHRKLITHFGDRKESESMCRIRGSTPVTKSNSLKERTEQPGQRPHEENTTLNLLLPAVPSEGCMSHPFFFGQWFLWPAR